MQGFTLRQQMRHMTVNAIATGLSLQEAKKAFEKEWIVLVLLANKGNQQKAAADLGVHRNTLYREMERLGITKEIIRDVRLREAAAIRIEKRRPMREAAMQAGA